MAAYGPGYVGVNEEKLSKDCFISLIEMIKDGQDMVEKLKRISLKNVDYWVASSWEPVGAGNLITILLKL